MQALKQPLSGYVGGHPTQGYWVKKLAEDWGRAFGVHHAIPCNSATSGLLAACMAAGIGPGDEVWVSTYTMSATAAAPMMLGAIVHFTDIDPKFFCMMPPKDYVGTLPKAIIVTNLFGCAAALPELRQFCNMFNIILIEDNAQAPFATIDGRLTGTIGHMGVFSLNIHKHMQCGEGGVVVTNVSVLADRLEGAINHGELNPQCVDPIRHSGLNLRMVEVSAAIACAQLKRGIDLVQSRIDLAEAISDIFNGVQFVDSPVKRTNEVHAYYLWAGKIKGDNARDIRGRFVTALTERGVPFRAGYSPPLHRLFREDVILPVAEDMEDNRLFTFEVCAYDLKSHHLSRMRDIILEEAEKIT
jgi:dTDP-4-amino-4,6-dideoxygalactose transaminase